MNKFPNDTDDAALETLFANARQFPLLAACEERVIDASKWLALQQLQQLMVSDPLCRVAMTRWTQNVLQHPPQLEDFAVREHYNLLRRELAGLLEHGERHAALQAFSERLVKRRASKEDRACLAALELPSCLVAGLAELLLEEPEPRGAAAALRAWQQFWIPLPAVATETLCAKTRTQLRRHLKEYYRAREQLVNHNLRLVFSIAGKLTGRGLAYRDLIQYGVIGLLRAAEKFQHEKGYRFSTYAYNWISQSIRQAIEDLRGIVRYPAGVNEQISKMHRARLHLLNSRGEEPDVDTLAQRLKMKPDALRRLQQVNNLAVSLETKINAGIDGLAVGDTLTGGPFEASSRAAEQISLNRCLLQRIGILEPAEQRVVIRRWGLDQGPQLSRAEIATQMDVSTEWVRQLESSALAKLRNDGSIREAYRDYVGFEQ